MSEYYQLLRGSVKERYVENLRLLEFIESDDPYSESNAVKFTDNLTMWPRVEYGHIFGYFVTRPGLYTPEQLLVWKQLDAYNYFQSGYVRTILVWRAGTLPVLKATVNPSQRAPSNVGWLSC